MTSIPSELTKRQEDFCRFVDDYQQEHEGLSPSFEEIAQGMDMKDRCSARQHFHLIEKKGYVTQQPGQTRSIRLTEKWRRYLNHKLNVLTNPMVEEVAGAHPELFEGWTAAEWEELRSIRGVGGDMTAQTVIEEAQKIAENREVVQQFQELLLCESTRQTTIDWLRKAYGEIDVRRRLPNMRKKHQ